LKMRLLFSLLKSSENASLSPLLSSSVFRRLKSDSAAAREVKISPNHLNRNPRNLESTGHQYKRFGWNLQYPPSDFYYQCAFEIKPDHLKGYVEHCSGTVVVSASTDEPWIRKHLFSATDTSAAVNIGRVLSERCLKMGLTNMTYLHGIKFLESEHEQAFHEEMTKGGVAFEEAEFQEGLSEVPGLDYERRNFRHERLNLPFPPEENYIKRKIVENNTLSKKI